MASSMLQTYAISTRNARCVELDNHYLDNPDNISLSLSLSLSPIPTDDLKAREVRRSCCSSRLVFFRLLPRLVT
jgi:hypothetical protein